MNFERLFGKIVAERLDSLDNMEISEAIDKYVRGERARNILKRRLIDEISQEQLAEEFDLSVAQLKRILYKAQNQFFSHYIY